MNCTDAYILDDVHGGIFRLRARNVLKRDEERGGETHLAATDRVESKPETVEDFKEGIGDCFFFYFPPAEMRDRSDA